MTFAERPVVFACDGDTLVGVASLPQSPHAVGVVVVVGGPQYRVGSHRQFVLLARALARGGYATLRFDYRGMGDASGAMRDFASLERDLDAAIVALLAIEPRLTHVVLWGLCDGASAIAMRCVQRDARVAGLVLVNPWVRDDATYATVQMRHYYRARLFDASVWRRWLTGRAAVATNLRDFARSLARSLRPGPRAAAEPATFQARMLAGLQAFAGPVLVVLSGNDLTAREFEQRAQAEPAWRAALARERIAWERVDAADHTFSRPEWEAALHTATLRWLAASAGGRS